MRTIAWVSGGAPSAVAAKLAITDDPETILYYTDPGSEHVDVARFLDDCEAWIGAPIQRVKSPDYVDTWDVWETERFIVGHHGAPCTRELKRRVRFRLEHPTDRQVFGYSIEEQHRVDRFREQNPGTDLWCPLIDRGLTKADCKAIMDRAGIELPAMYRLGYQNANCIGCPKGGMGYWNKIRVDFPLTFLRMAQLEQDLDHAILSDASGPVFLRDLDPNRGNIGDEPGMDCSLLCVLAEDAIAAGES